MPLNETLLDRYLAECKAFEIKYPRGNAPKAEKAALDALYLASVNETPSQLQAVLDGNNDTVGHKAAVTSVPGWDGRSVRRAA